MYDVVVVGAGATGLMSAIELTGRGLRVALVDAGPMQHDTGPVMPLQQPVQSMSWAYSTSSSQYFVLDTEHPYTNDPSKPFVWIRGRQVGGRLLTWMRVSLRLSDFEFKAASRDGIGEDWPLDHSQLAPSYSRVEQLWRVCGSEARLPQLPDGVFVRPLPQTAVEDRIRTAWTTVWPDRLLVPGRLALARPGNLLQAALETGRLSMLPSVVVRSLAIDHRGQVRAVLCTGSGGERELQARAVVLAASTIESARILLLSKCARFPYGLANSSGLVGRYLTDHCTVFVGGVMTSVSPPHYGSISCLPRFRNLRSQGERRLFKRGYGVQVHVFGAGGLGLNGRFAPLAQHAKETGGTAVWLYSLGEVLPNVENQVALDPTCKDVHGVPVVRIEYAYGPVEQDMQADQQEALTAMCKIAGIECLAEPERGPPGWSVHEVGTVRMGTDRRTSVLNKYNQSWDVPNLFVVDGSCFTSAGWQNPTLTMMALASRASLFLANELNSGRLH
jgi:choline dehydrogenase-like flavoprotein